ncbi:MAG: hypothetical protein SPI59_00840 [Finegoldia sp.]|nr:hypothetical protein [Finegoldia sp.]
MISKIFEKDYRNLWIHLKDKNQSELILKIIRNLEDFFLNLITIEGEEDPDLITYLEELNLDCEILFTKDEDISFLKSALRDIEDYDLICLSDLDFLASYFKDNDIENYPADLYIYDKYLDPSFNKIDKEAMGTEVFVIGEDLLNKVLDENSFKLDTDYKFEDLKAAFVLYAYTKKDHLIYSESSLLYENGNLTDNDDGVETYLALKANVEKFQDFIVKNRDYNEGN